MSEDVCRPQFRCGRSRCRVGTLSRPHQSWQIPDGAPPGICRRRGGIIDIGRHRDHRPELSVIRLPSQHSNLNYGQEFRSFRNSCLFALRPARQITCRTGTVIMCTQSAFHARNCLAAGWRVSADRCGRALRTLPGATNYRSWADSTINTAEF